jgi:hypothetical protein
MATLVHGRASRAQHAGRMRWPAIAALVLLAVVSPFAALCFGDGHVAVEAMLAPHQFVSRVDSIASPGSRSEMSSHGPCVDALLDSAIRDGAGCPPLQAAGPSDLAGALDRSDAGAPSLLADRWARIGRADVIAPAARSVGGTVLRI